MLSGGGPPRAAQVGMLRALSEAGITADALVGTSVGALNAGFLAGRDPAGGIAPLEVAWRRLRRRDVFPLHAPTLWRALTGRSNHLFPHGALRAWIAAHLTYDAIEASLIPVKVIAADAVTADEVILDRGDPVTALLASAALPVAFPPVEVGGRRLIDGGITSNSALRVALDWPAPAGRRKAIYVLPTDVQRDHDGPPGGLVRTGHAALEMLIAQQLGDEIELFLRARERFGDTERVAVLPSCPESRSWLAPDFRHIPDYIEEGYRVAKRWLEAGAPGVGQRGS